MIRSQLAMTHRTFTQDAIRHLQNPLALIQSTSLTTAGISADLYSKACSSINENRMSETGLSSSAEGTLVATHSPDQHPKHFRRP